MFANQGITQTTKGKDEDIFHHRPQRLNKRRYFLVFDIDNIGQH